MTLNLYATLDELKARVDLADTDDDAILDAVLEAVSRDIDEYLRTHFYGLAQTRYFTTSDPSCVRIDDLVSLTSLATDDAGDRTWPTSWASTDYDLEPVNNPQRPVPAPYWKIETAPNGRYSFPTCRRGVRVIGRWGRYDVLTTSSATLAEALDTSETGVDVSSGAAFKVGQVIEIDSERMEISAIATNTLTVERAVNGTTAAAHDSAAAIRVATFPIVGEACLLQAQRNYATKNLPQGVAGGTSLGVEVRQAYSVGLHPFVKDKLRPLRVPRAG